MISSQRSLFLSITLFMQMLPSAIAFAEGDSSKNASQLEVVFETSKGSFVLELYPDKAPKTVANFLTYVDDGFYRNTVFHRVIPGFVIQGGGFEKGMNPKQNARPPVKNESNNRLKNTRGTISMARRTHPDTATSQFYINLSDNANLDYTSSYQPGYTVFGKVTDGMELIDSIAKLPTKTLNRMKDVPEEEVVIVSAKRKGATAVDDNREHAELSGKKYDEFIAGEHYLVLERPVPTRDNEKIEVVEMFSYGCPHCYEFEATVKDWSKRQPKDVDYWAFPAVWNKAMALYARAFYVAHDLNVAEKIHQPLFTAIVIEQKSIRNESDLAEFFAIHGVDKEVFTSAFNSTAVATKVKHAEERVRLYKPAGAPEIIVNGKYRVDRMRAGGLTEMLAVVDFLIDNERARSAE